MKKVTKNFIEDLKNNSIDRFNYPDGNFWIYHDKRDNKFYGVKHQSGKYFISKGTKYFTEILRAIWSSENKMFVNPNSDGFWN